MPAAYQIPRLPVSSRVYHSWRPRARVNTLEWVCENVRDKDGTPFDIDRFPWMRGVFEAFDLPHVRIIAQMWATRIGKTFGGHAIHEKVWSTNPMPTAFISAIESLARATVSDEIYPMLEHCPPLRDQLLPEPRRSTKRIELRDCTGRIAWAGSESRMAGFGVFFGHLNEVSKWKPSASGDRVNQALERIQKQFPDYKVVVESSPELAGTCRISQIVAASDDRRYLVPCPHCGTFQLLQLGDVTMPTPAGLIWDRTKSGGEDPELAYRTARYICCDCHKEIADEQKYGANKRGVWTPKGQWVDKQGKLQGEAERPNCTTWGSQLSSLYSPNLRWADVAKKKVEDWPRPATRQTFVNTWLGEAYDFAESKTEPEELGEKLEVETARGIVPGWVSFLTSSVDRQAGHFVLGTYGWGSGERGHLVDHDVADTWEDVLAYLDRRWPVEGASEELAPVITLVDEGYKAKEARKFAKRHSTLERRILVCKGASNDLGGEPYKKYIIGQAAKKVPKRQRKAALAAHGVVRVMVGVDYFEAIIQDYFDERKPGEPGSLSIYATAGDDLDFCKQLLNGTRSVLVNRRNDTDYLWVKRWAEFPNDERDVLRYNRCAAEMWARGTWSRRSAAATFKQGATASVAVVQGSVVKSQDSARKTPPAKPPAAKKDLERKTDDDRRRDEQPKGFIKKPPGRFIRALP